MKNIYFALILLFSCSQKESDQKFLNGKFILVEDLKFDTEYFDQIRILRDTGLIAGSFDSITFLKNDKVVFSVRNEDGYDSLPNVFKGVKNSSNSKLIFISKLDHQYLISLFGFEYGCCPRKLTLLNIDKNGFHKVLDEEFDTRSIEAVGDEEFLFGQKYFGQCLTTIDSLGVNICGYTPLLIYKIENGLLLDSMRTKTWNESNYVFRGFNADHDIWIAIPIKTGLRPYVFKEKNEKSGK